jgi:DNA invertase Pin-like site-specific DNA recombinase
MHESQNIGGPFEAARHCLYSSVVAWTGIHNQESQRRQYGLADHARQLGFQQVEIIDEDLGRSGSGQVERPGFQHLVAEVCTGQVGGVLCIEASRLARNGRDWHHLIELCGLVRALAGC